MMHNVTHYVTQLKDSQVLSSSVLVSNFPENNILISLTWINQLILSLMGGAHDTCVTTGDSHLCIGHFQRSGHHCELRVYLRGTRCTLYFSIFFLHYSSNCILFSIRGACYGLNVCVPSELIC